MNTRKVLLALSTALALGLFGTSLAQANHGGSGDGRASHVGPMGQTFGGGVPAFINGRSANGTSAYGYAPHHVYKHYRAR
jgi:hypothetical protein